MITSKVLKHEITNSLSNSYVNINDTDIKSIIETLHSNVISGKGKELKQFENLLTKHFGSQYSLCCSNGTMAILMVLIILNIEEGDEIILPCTAPIMTVLPILHLKAKPVFVDNMVNTFNIDLEDLKNKISNKTKLIINVPMWGYANNIKDLSIFCKKSKKNLLEDNSHCHGTLINKQFLGTFGDFSIFSTHERKLITTGEGAFILTKKEKHYNQLVELRSFGEATAHTVKRKNLIGSYGYTFGLNFKMSAINAALGITQLKKMDQKIIQRHKNADYIKLKLKGILNKNIFEINNKIKDSIDNYYSIAFTTTYKDKINIEKTLAENNIISDPLRYKYCPLYNFKIVNIKNNKCKNSEDLIKRIFTLPVHEGLSKKELNLITTIVNNYFGDIK